MIAPDGVSPRQPAPAPNISRWLALAGAGLALALLPLLGQPTLAGSGSAWFAACFTTAWLAYVLGLRLITRPAGSLWVIWGWGVAARLVMLASPLLLSDDVYRYIWDGHLLVQGANPYALPVNHAALDAYHTPLRELVNFPWMATPYLPAAQGYFALVAWIAPQSVLAFQVSGLLLDLAAGWLVMQALGELGLPRRAVLVYLWNPLVIIEFARGAHVDALMLALLAGALLGLARGHRTLSALALAGAVLVKGWPALVAPLFVRRWGLWRTALFGLAVSIPVAAFAAGAGWGLSGPTDGRGLFGALRIYSQDWQYNSGLYAGLEALMRAMVGAERGPALARLLAMALPGLAGLWLGGRALFSARGQCGNAPAREVQPTRCLVRQAALPLGLYLLLAPAVFPWYLAVLLVLLPFFWPAEDEPATLRRWVWPWVYFTLFEGWTYISYSGLPAPDFLGWLQLAGYLPLWGLLVWAGRPSISA